jgi:hypothetical protein
MSGASEKKLQDLNKAAINLELAAHRFVAEYPEPDEAERDQLGLLTEVIAELRRAIRKRLHGSSRPTGSNHARTG